MPEDGQSCMSAPKSSLYQHNLHMSSHNDRSCVRIRKHPSNHTNYTSNRMVQTRENRQIPLRLHQQPIVGRFLVSLSASRIVTKPRPIDPGPLVNIVRRGGSCPMFSFESRQGCPHALALAEDARGGTVSRNDLPRLERTGCHSSRKTVWKINQIAGRWQW